MQVNPNGHIEDERYHQVVARLMTDSTLESECTKMVLAETVAGLHMLMGQVVEKAENEPLALDTLKAMPAYASNIKRLCDSLGVNREREEAFEF
jgi:hypothetical protein